MKQAPDQRLKARLRDVWTQTRLLVEQRVAQLGRVAEGLQEGSLDAVQREDAILVAHKLAGSLGMFGLDQASECAKQIESLLSETPDAVEFARMVSRLKSLLPANGDLTER